MELLGILEVLNIELGFPSPLSDFVSIKTSNRYEKYLIYQKPDENHTYISDNRVKTLQKKANSFCRAGPKKRSCLTEVVP